MTPAKHNAHHKSPSEVRFEYLRPHQVRARRQVLDVALLPLGTLEWHGLQNPLGLDGLKVHHVCCEAARLLGGGVVFPPVFWGVPRDSFHVDVSLGQDLTGRIAQAYGTDPETVIGRSSHGGMDLQEQWLAYQRHLRMCLEQIAGFGFSSVYLCTGHNPLVHFVRPVAIAFTRSTRMAGRAVTTDWGSESDAPADVNGDHGGRWETSLMMAARPDSVDMSELEPADENVFGTSADAVHADEAQGRAWIAHCAEAIAAEARWLAEHYPDLPPRHRHLR